MWNRSILSNVSAELVQSEIGIWTEMSRFVRITRMLNRFGCRNQYFPDRFDRFRLKFWTFRKKPFRKGKIFWLFPERGYFTLLLMNRTNWYGIGNENLSGMSALSGQKCGGCRKKVDRRPFFVTIHRPPQKRWLNRETMFPRKKNIPLNHIFQVGKRFVIDFITCCWVKFSSSHINQWLICHSFESVDTLLQIG